MLKKAYEYLLTLLLAFLSALNYTIFVFPNSFAPSGIDGICTMIQDVTGVSMGYLSLLVNIPLIIAAFLYLNRDFAIKTSIYVLSFSFSVVLLKFINISDFHYVTETGTSIVLAPVVAGAIRGILYALSLRLNASSGGVDIIAGIIKIKNPYLNFMNIIFGLNILIAISSYFVYGMKPEPAICSIIYAFITSNISNRIQSTDGSTAKFEIITTEPERLCQEISDKLNQTATIMDARGAYTGSEKKIVLCVVDKKKVPYLESLVLEYPGCVVFKSSVSNSLSGITYK